MEFSLPEEMWFRIWSDLDFETLQKTCVLVCQGWFKNIRDDGRLSGQLSLKNAEMEEEEAKAILSKWKELRILRLSKNLDQVDLSKTHKFLKKVIVPNVPEGYENVSQNVLEDYPVSVNKICFNPQDKSRSIGLDNIIESTLHFMNIFEYEKPFEPMGEMKNLIRLKIIFEEEDFDDEDDDLDFNFIEPLFQGIGFSSDLDEVRLEFGLYCGIQICGDLIFRYLSQITKLEIVSIHQDDFNANLEDLLWIQKLRSLKSLVVSDLNIVSESDDQGNEPFFETPMTNVKRLELCGSRFYYQGSTFFLRLSENFPALHTLTITESEFNTCHNWDISVLESILNGLGSIKNLEISGMRCELKIPDGFDKPMVKSVMQEALEIIEKKFPFDSSEIKISAVVTHTSTRVGTGYSPAKPSDGYCFDIIKKKGKGPSLKIWEIKPIPPRCIKCLKKRANVGKRGMCSVCY